MQRIHKTLSISALLLSSVLPWAAQASSPVVNNNITHQEVLNAQQAWGEALINISQTYEKQGHAAAKTLASQVLDQAYGYQQGAVLFKPTLASGQQTFRTDVAGSLAYFVGGNSDYAQDSGFALKGWKEYRFENAAVYINGDLALTMGNVILVDKQGQTTMVDKSWAFKKDEQGQLRIVLHHSSLPYQP
ncbi:phosphoribosyl-AMP cyclohydrolase [Vibrio metschnikovii]|uniref:phosphoribosyl-AMP cyclohydrolase n=1 Tax=Vibrio metschnikovii TaxID=28172 RepID=UPI002FCADD0A